MVNGAMNITRISCGDNEHVEAVSAEDIAYRQGQRSNSYRCDSGHQLWSGSSQSGEHAADQGLGQPGQIGNALCCLHQYPASNAGCDGHADKPNPHSG